MYISRWTEFFILKNSIIIALSHSDGQLVSIAALIPLCHTTNSKHPVPRLIIVFDSSNLTIVGGKAWAMVRRPQTVVISQT